MNTNNVDYKAHELKTMKIEDFDREEVSEDTTFDYVLYIIASSGFAIMMAYAVVNMI